MSDTVLDVRQMLKDELRWAKKQREKVHNGQFEMRVTLVGHVGQIGHPPDLQWHSRDEMRKMMGYLARIAYVFEAQAVMIATDTTMMEAQAVARHLKIAEPRVDDPGSVKNFYEEYGKHFRGELKGEMRNLPRHLWEDALLVSIKGPKIGTSSLRVKYAIDSRERVYFEPEEASADATSLEMLCDWWELADDDAGVKFVRRQAQEEMDRMRANQ